MLTTEVPPDEKQAGFLLDSARRAPNPPDRRTERDTGRMTTVTVVAIERSGPAIHAALAEHVPGDEHLFEAELRDALTRAADDLDLADPQAVLARWHALATMAANPLSADERAQVARAKANDLTGLRTRDEHGNWTTL